MRIRHLLVYRHDGVLHIERGPDPDCDNCGGTGETLTADPSDPETPLEEPCHCDPWPHRPGVRVRYRAPQPMAGPFADEPPF